MLPLKNEKNILNIQSPTNVENCVNSNSIMKENLKIRGHFKLECFDKSGNLIDKFEEHNLVVLGARKHFMKLIGGAYDSNKIINRFVLGTDGVVGEDSIPKSEEDGLNPTLEDLFCKTTDPNKRGILFEEINFTPSTNDSYTQATNIQDGSNNNSVVNVIVDETSLEPSISYIFNIPTDAFNGKNDYMKFNEAGLFAGDTLIAIRTFKTKAKDSSVSMKVTWSLIF